MYEIREFLDHNFVYGPRTLKPKKPKTRNNLKTFLTKDFTSRGSQSLFQLVQMRILYTFSCNIPHML